MSQNARNAIVVAVAVTAFMAVLPPALIGGAKGNAWKFVADYQTLITGVAAVLAAYATIRQMERTDARSEQRHRELIELSLRADKLKIARLYDPQSRDLADYIEQLSDIREFIINLHGSSEMDYAALESVEKPIFNAIYGLEEILERPVWNEASPLFDGPMTSQLAELRANIHQMRVTLQLASQAGSRFDEFLRDKEEGLIIDFGTGVGQYPDEASLRQDYERSVYVVPQFMDDAIAPATAVLKQLFILAREYGLR
ncbi:hypothetical protein ELH50_30300 (plasmid) [Rhizobium ruizarguesonis]|uniref:hypothetical protein n=1 Tax=Rhizobium ruizarguesonis TaxID=2081791 RepID=UPI001030AD7F|nr:hypothetical protein [Rhizobium ruizarguesonis]TAT74815.1 hypothetical protein ELI52_28845 [Rhizobium ruizarguesonis]TBA99072.1 hypothetical protein ELH50_30300 [Rhizobium ruizarguesonis]